MILRLLKPDKNLAVWGMIRPRFTNKKLCGETMIRSSEYFDFFHKAY